MEILAHFYSYKNGLETTLTIIMLFQALYLFSLKGPKNVAFLLGLMFLLLSAHFFLLSLTHIFLLSIPDSLLDIPMAIYGPFCLLITIKLLDIEIKHVLVLFFGAIGIGLATFKSVYLTAGTSIGAEYIWNILFLTFVLIIFHQNATSLTRHQAKWLSQFLTGFIIIFFAYIPVFIANKFYEQFFLPVKIPFTFLFLIFVLNNFWHVIFRPQALTTIRFASGELNQQELEQIASKIEACMSNHKPYLEPGFDLKRLSAMVHESERRISESINRVYHQNFSQFVNDYRVKNAVELMKDNAHNDLLIKEIMYASGFNHKVSFNNAFKSKLGVSPSLYRKSLTASAKHI